MDFFREKLRTEKEYEVANYTDEDKKEVDNRIEGLKVILQSFQDKIQDLGDEKLSLNSAIEMFDHMNKERHDIFLNMVQSEMNLELSIGDADPKDTFLQETDNQENSDINGKYRIIFQQDPWCKYNKTPDIFIVNKSKGIVNEIIAIDVAVTVNSKNAAITKLEKYKEIKTLFHEFQPKLEVICFDLNNNRVESFGDIKHDLGNMKTTGFTEIIQKSNEVKDMIKRALEEKELCNLNNWIQNSKTMEDEGAKPIKDFNFGLSLEEFQIVTKNNKNIYDRFRNSLSSNHRQLLFETLMATRIRDEDKHEIVRFGEMFGVTVQDVNEEDLYTNLFNKHFSDAYGYEADDLPAKPSSEELKDAFFHSEKESRSIYAVLERKKIYNPLFLNFSKNEMSKNYRGSMIKKKRMQNVISKLQSASDEGIIGGIKKIFSISKSNDQFYDERVLTGNYYVKRDGSLISKEDYNKESANARRNVRMRTIKSEEEPNKYEYLEKNIEVACYRKGEVIQIKPGNTKDIEEILKSGGIGLKVGIEERTSVEKKKVKSLKFWDNQELERLVVNFEDQAYRLENNLMKIGKELLSEEFKEFSKNVLDVNSEESDSSGPDTNDDDNDNRYFERGMKYFMRHNEILWENISFAAQMGGNGFRVVQGISDNSLVMMLPCESIMKGDKGVPFINISIIEKGSVHNNFNDDKVIKWDNDDGTSIVVSKGRRVDRPRIEGYLQIKPKFYTAVAIINHNRLESGQSKMSRFEQSKLALICSNININTSSLLDNVRYMAENCMADYSFCKKFIIDKFSVPIKNEVQAYLYSRTKELLINLRDEMSKVRVKKAMVDDEGNTNTETSRIIKGEFSSLLDHNTKYRKPEHILSEIYTLFFSVPKGLHGNFHVLLDIHKTPLSIQNEIREKHGKEIPMSCGVPKSRYEFNPEVIVLASLEAEKNMINSSRNTRNNFEIKEKINETPLRIKTLSSTRSTLVEDKDNVSLDQDGTLDMETNPMLSEVKHEEIERLLGMIYEMESKLVERNKSDCKKDYKRLKMRLSNKAEFHMISEEGRKQLMDFMNMRVKMNYDTKTLEHNYSTKKMNFRAKIKNRVRTKGGNVEDLTFHSSRAVLTKILDEVLKEERKPGGELESISIKAKNSVLSPDRYIFGIRKKGQRTQKDREIYVTDLECKKGLYIMEHYYKQVCYNIIEEKISEPGDMKIISMDKQTRNCFNWLSKESRRYREINKGTALEEPLISCHHFNIDMTKWAPKDNLFKFIFMVAANHGLTISEKLFMFGLMIKLGNKLLHIEDELMYKLAEISEKEVRTGVDDPKEELFYKMTKGFMENKVKIELTWLMGQMNYSSSLIHAGCSLLWRKMISCRYPMSSFLFQLNVHSDDNQSTVASIRDPIISENELIEKLWSTLDYLVRSCCIELSNKKSNISKTIKQFVSQYNIASEQVYLWCKPVMSAISGCPYTTLKDDMSSLMSKISEALSKGAPKTVVNVTLNEMKLQIWNLYGVRTKKQGNYFSQNLNIEHEYLPEYLGGDHIHDYTTLAIAGPKSKDQMVLAKLLKYTGATTEREPNITPPKNIQRALLLFYVSDLLTSETIEEEEDISSSITLNPLKPTRFKTSRNGLYDPFRDLYGGSKEEAVKELKKQNPGLGLLKPTTSDDIIHYYMILYNNHNFKASLAGQSPAVLHLNKIASKKRGLFRIKNSENINLLKYKEGDDPDNMTQSQFCNLLTKMINSIGYDNSIASYLRTKYITADPEFKILNFTSSNALKTSAVIKKNPLPRRKPSPRDYSTIINKIPMLLCYIFDEDYFTRNNFKLQYPTATPQDMVRLNEIFPVEFSWLRGRIMEQRELIRLGELKEEEFSFKNYISEVSKIASIEADKMKIERMMDKKDNEIMAERTIIERVMNLELIKRTGGSASLMEPTRNNKLLELKENFDIFSRLVNGAKIIKENTTKVIFCAPTRSNEIHDIALATKTQIESSGDISVGYFLSHNQKQEMRSIRNALIRGSNTETLEYISQLTNAVIILKKLGAKNDTIMRLIKESSMGMTTILEVDENYNGLPRRFKKSAAILLSMVYPSKIHDYVNKFENMTIVWTKKQEIHDINFLATIHYENMMITVSGTGNMIMTMNISFSGQLSLYYLNNAIKSFLSDLIFRDRTMTKKIDLRGFLQTRKIDQAHSRKYIGISTIKNEFVEANSQLCNYTVVGMRVERNRSSRHSMKAVQASIDKESCSINYKMEGGEENSIYMYPFKNTFLSDLDLPDIIMEHVRVRDVLRSHMSKCILENKLYNITMDEVIKVAVNPDDVCMNYGTFGSNFCYRIMVGDETVFKNIDVMEEWLEDKRRALKKEGLREDSDDDDTDEEIKRDKIMQKFRYNRLMDYMNSFDKGFVSSEEMVNLKMNEWDNLMKYVHEFDLRSVRKALILAISEREINKGDNKTNETTAELMIIDFDEGPRSEMVRRIKEMKGDGDLLRFLLEESQIYVPSEIDVSIFNYIIHILVLCSRSQKHRRIFKYLHNRLNRMAMSPRYADSVFTSVCCYIMGSRYLELYEKVYRSKLSIDDFFKRFDTLYKKNRCDLSPYVISMCDSLKTSMKSLNEYNADQKSGLFDAFENRFKKSRKGMTKEEKKKMRANPKYDETVDTTSVNRMLKNNPDLERRMKNDPSALAEALEQSKYYPSSSEMTRSEISDSEAQKEIRMRMQRPTLLEVARELTVVSLTKSAEINDEEFDAMLEGDDDGETWDEFD